MDFFDPQLGSILYAHTRDDIERLKLVLRVKKTGLFLAFIISLLWVGEAEASHLRAGQITVSRIDPKTGLSTGCNSREVWITIRVYTNTASPVVFGGDGILAFGDGTSMVIPEVNNTLKPELGPNIGVAEITVRHIYGSIGRYTLSYVEPNRNGGVLNMDNSFYTTFYLETQIDFSVTNCHFPDLKIPPIDQACTGAAFSHNPGAVDGDATDSLSYELAIPFRDRNQPVINYRRPDNSAFSFKNELGDPFPTFSIDSISGTLVWDSPGVPGEYNVAFHVNEWKKINGVWIKIGYVRRDMQIIVNDDCNNERPQLIIPDDVCVVAGTTITEEISGTDENNIKIQAYSEVFSLNTSPATIAPNWPDGDGGFESPPATINFNWNTVCAHVKGTPYQVTFKVTDNPTAPPKVKLVSFATWQITVVAPAPVLTSVTPQFPQRYANLSWDSYECFPNASSIQIWRKVGATSFTPAHCDTGMPESLGFTLVAEQNIRTSTGVEITNFTDTNNGKGLEPGGQYCYRIVAVFRDKGAESYVSNELCLDPIETASPIITNVTVDRTGDNDGEITVKWIEPLDPGTYATPFSYQLQRVQGSGYLNVSPIMQETFTFTDAGLDTRDQQYSYRVLFYENGSSIPVDSSSLASSVWLDLTTGKGWIDLNWRANVPWSNQIEGQVHDIHRELEVEPVQLSELPFYKVVNVSAEGMRYTDADLDTTKVHCYAVVTRGGYGNTDIPEPLENVSQINCATPTVSNSPCKPQLVVGVDPCSGEQDCGSATTVYSNLITWKKESGCDAEIRGYNVYRASRQNGTYEKLNKTVLLMDTFYVDNNLFTTAYCYKVTAVDRSNMESEKSDPVCFEPCANYELPNMFSPNGDGCNDRFSAYGADLQLPDDFKCKPDPNDKSKCARFVDKVVFKVYNRWGVKVYDYTGRKNNENNIYINWDGRDNSGKELASAVYYYTAEVTFDSTNPGGRTKTLKGWVHLIR